MTQHQNQFHLAGMTSFNYSIDYFMSKGSEAGKHQILTILMREMQIKISMSLSLERIQHFQHRIPCRRLRIHLGNQSMNEQISVGVCGSGLPNTKPDCHHHYYNNNNIIIIKWRYESLHVKRPVLATFAWVSPPVHGTT